MHTFSRASTTPFPMVRACHPAREECEKTLRQVFSHTVPPGSIFSQPRNVTDGLGSAWKPILRNKTAPSPRPCPATGRGRMFGNRVIDARRLRGHRVEAEVFGIPRTGSRPRAPSGFGVNEILADP